jgi:topoisomerase-4 subunit A
LLHNQDQREDLIIADLTAIAKEYGGKRLTEVRDGAELSNATQVDKRDLIAQEDVYVVATRDGYLKRSARSRAGKARAAQNGARPGIKAGDGFIYNGLASTTDYMLLFTSRGNYLYIPVNEIKETKWNDEGFHVSSSSVSEAKRNWSAALPSAISANDLYFVLLSKKGLIKRIAFRRASRSSAEAKAIPPSNSSMTMSSSALASRAATRTCWSFQAMASAVYYNENDILITNPRTGGLKAGSFKGQDLVDVLSFYPDEGGKIALITDRDCTRVFDLCRISSFPPGF